ncbi:MULTISPECIES: YbaK/EbsC family protein [unclassified Novosphingobium]|uniref:YbaK/EbsC family protein n=1 Tax=unclassified Novosphingobium TaxID=2644732 RepID=UPI000EDFA382|nr:MULTISPECIES: YbaK/EbsC family protein [unclassified Novosphingobium]HCF24731.1 cys-tRNA(pro)/cys-tRNA(cys) deacylase [Novosphingobium sp.]HQV02060.1 YbaK/EbsC family protein [Novosphingobium sp.]
MSAESVMAWLAEHAPDLALIDHSRSTATVAEAADVLGVEPGRIAKTLAFRVGETVYLLLARGDARLDNGKCKAELGGRPRMLDPEETLAVTGHAVGGVCPFGLASDLPIVADRSLLAYETVFPAAGSQTNSLELTPQRLAELVGARWVEICKLPE